MTHNAGLHVFRVYVMDVMYADLCRCKAGTASQIDAPIKHGTTGRDDCHVGHMNL